MLPLRAAMLCFLAFESVESKAVVVTNGVMLPINTECVSEFGQAVAADGDFVVVGSPSRKASCLSNSDGGSSNSTNTSMQEVSGGSAEVWTRIRNSGNDTWTNIILDTYVQYSRERGSDFGRSVAIDHTTVVVGAPGAKDTSQQGTRPLLSHCPQKWVLRSTHANWGN